jgi:hypothetical protein
MSRALLMLAAPALMLAGCAEAVAEDRVRSALVGAGLPEPTAECMAARMVNRLTIAQLRKLEALKGDESQSGRATLQDYLGRVRAVGDSEVIAVTASSGALCAAGVG